MDGFRTEPREVAVQQKATALTEEIPRQPLVPSEKNNAVPPARKPRAREVMSRYKSGIAPTTSSLSTDTAPRRCPSPNVNRTASTPMTSIKRAHSAEKRRPSAPLSRSSTPSTLSRPSTPSPPSSRSSTPVRDSAAEMHLSSQRFLSGRTPDGLWPSMRSLCTSFQSESISVPHSKRDKPLSYANATPDHKLKSSVNVVSERKRTPLRGRITSDQSENSKPTENSRATLKDQHRWPGIAGAKLSAGAMTRSMDLTDKVSRPISLPVSLRGVSPSRRVPVSDGPGRGQKSTNEVTRRMSLDGSVRLERESSGTCVSSKMSECAPPSTRPTRTQSSPLPGMHRPSSPSKASLTHASLNRGISSPSRTRPSTPFSSSTTGRANSTSSVLSYIADVQKRKKSANHVEDAHELRMLYNRVLEWRFVNARANALLSNQKAWAENILYSVWATISELRDSVIMKRINMQQLRQAMKLEIILKEQMTYLEDWALLEREHSSSLSGAIEALRASTLRLPVTGGARADFHTIKDAVSSAVDLMQAIGSSNSYLLARVEGANCLVSELADVAAKERLMLGECREILASTAAMQAQECSLRTHLLQLGQDVMGLS